LQPGCRVLAPPAGWKNRLFSFDFAALPQNQTKKIVTSMLPQARNACCGASNYVTVSFLFVKKEVLDLRSKTSFFQISVIESGAWVIGDPWCDLLNEEEV
jgi:hypothetical protein